MVRTQSRESSACYRTAGQNHLVKFLNFGLIARLLFLRMEQFFAQFPVFTDRNKWSATNIAKPTTTAPAR
jgi:hypothetical protein